MMSLKQKRAIVRRFKAGESIWRIAARTKELEYGIYQTRIEQVIRDYMHGRFVLEPKRKKGNK